MLDKEIILLELLELAIGEKEENFMKNKKRERDPDMPVGKLRIIEDFLPPPEVLAKAPRRVRVTMELDLETFRFFQKQAEKHGGKYQRMIREALRRYAAHFKAA